MMKQLLLVAGLVLSMVLVSCESTTNPDPVAPTPPDAPTALMATSVDATTVGLRWTAPAAGVTPTGYVVTVQEEGSSTIQEAPVGGAATSASIIGLTAGTVYNFTVYALNDTARSTPTATIKWAPAERVTANLRLYETNSSMGSGIQLPSTAGLTVSSGGQWDIALDTDGELFDIGSPTKTTYVEGDPLRFVAAPTQSPRVTVLGKIWEKVTSLDDIYESADLSTETLEEKLFRFNTADASGDQFAFVVKTEGGNYAKVLVKANGGKLLQGTAPDRYIELEVSYQSGENLPYALKGSTGSYTKKVGNFIETNVKKSH